MPNMTIMNKTESLRNILQQDSSQSVAWEPPGFPETSLNGLQGQNDFLRYFHYHSLIDGTMELSRDFHDVWWYICSEG